MCYDIHYNVFYLFHKELLLYVASQN